MVKPAVEKDESAGSAGIAFGCVNEHNELDDGKRLNRSSSRHFHIFYTLKAPPRISVEFHLIKLRDACLVLLGTRRSWFFLARFASKSSRRADWTPSPH